MFTLDAFSEYQGQFTETQKNLTSLWEGYQQQLLESQKKLLNSWASSFPTGTAPANFSESFDRSMVFQQELVNTTLDAQQAAISLVIETQKQLWGSYFQMTQKAMQGMPTAS
jgi:hypothetical protein